MVGIQAIVLSALALLPAALAGPTELYARGRIEPTEPIPCNGSYVRAMNPPATRRCDAPGTIGAPAQVGAQSKPGSEIACVEKGKSTEGVISYSWTASSGVCKLFSKRIIDMQFRKSQSGTVYTNLKCWKLQCQCSDPDHPDLCGTQCTDFDADPNNCGKCGQSCDGPCFIGSCSIDIGAR